MPQLQELRQQAAELGARIQTAATEYRARLDAGSEPWPDETRAAWLAMNQEYDDFLAQIEREQEAADVAARSAAVQEHFERGRRDGATPDTPAHPLTPETRLRDLGATDRREATTLQQTTEDRSLCLQAWATRGICDDLITDRHRDAIQRQQFDVSQSELRLSMLDTLTFRGMRERIMSRHQDARPAAAAEWIEQRALNTGLGAAGGFLVPSTLVRAFEIAQLSYAGMMQVAEVMTTPTGGEMQWPVGNDTTNTGSYTDENQDQSSNATDPSFEQVVFRSYSITSGFVKVSFATLRDAFIDLESVLGAMLGERVGRKLGTETTTGTAKIRGMITRAAAGQTAAGATAITYADILGLEHSVDPALRARASFMMHDAVLEVVRGITDAVSGRPLWQPNVALALPDTFNGRAFAINQNMASSVAASAKTIAFGDMPHYKIRRVGPSLRIKRLVERFAESDQIAFIAYGDYDGNLLRPNADASCPVKYLIQAAS